MNAAREKAGKTALSSLRYTNNVVQARMLCFRIHCRPAGG